MVKRVLPETAEALHAKRMRSSYVDEDADLENRRHTASDGQELQAEADANAWMPDSAYSE